MHEQKPDLSAAYSLETPEDSKRLYADWAATYDQSFAADKHYQLHLLTARAFVQAGGRGPLLDAGAGTGLCGVELARLGAGPIDATDISPDMLAEALRKDVYRDVIEADLLQGIPVPPGSYAGVVSSGTFTCGHIGPEALPALLRVARPGAQFALSINARHYKSDGFPEAFDRLLRGQWIRKLSLPEARIYTDAAKGPHKDDKALIALFQKA